MKMRSALFAAILAALPAQALADEAPGDMPADPHAMHKMHDMPGMEKSNREAMPEMPMAQGLLGPYPATRDASGTAWQPDASEHGGLHAMLDGWMLMGHLQLNAIYDTQSGPRGADKAFVAGMFMGSARRDFGSGTLSLRAMLSPDPFMGKRGYPLLLAGGETADGVTHLVDRQHPHDLFMELSASYSQRVSHDDSVFVYFGYPGEPALGPAAFMHRPSGMDNPAAPISHHWLDSTHITYGVATAGFVHGNWKLEVSQFTGREPDQHRFDFDNARFDSTSARITFNPDDHWSMQVSYGHIVSPEQLDSSIDENRFTASATYVTKLGDESSLAATLAFGAKHLSDGTDLNALLFEAEYKPADLWTLFTRAEWKQDEELGLSRAEVGEFTLGAIRDFQVAEHARIGLGASYSFAFAPDSLVPSYGGSPGGTMVFTRLAIE